MSESIFDNLGTPASKPRESWPVPAEIGSIGAPAPTFPLEALPDCVRRFVEDTAERMQAPAEFVAIPALVALATAIGKGVRIRPKRNDDWSEPAIVWAMLVGTPGSFKSPAQSAAFKPIRTIEARWAKEDEAALAEFVEACAAAAEKKTKKDKDAVDDDVALPPKPPTRRLTVQNTTLEKLADLQSSSPRGMTMVFDELSGWAANLSRYTNGTDRQFFLEAWSGGSYRVDRIGRGSQLVSDLHLSICGGIQPEVVRALFGKDADDGLLDRFGLVAYPDPRRNFVFVDRWPDGEARKAYSETVGALVDTDWRVMLSATRNGSDEIPFVRFSDGAQRIFNDWYTRHMRDRSTWASRPEGGLMAKAGSTVARLTLVLHLAGFAAREHGNAAEVSAGTLKKALTLTETYLVPTWRRLHNVFGVNPAEAGARRIAKLILEKKSTAIRRGDITKLEWRGLKSIEDVQQAFAVLVDADWLAKPETKTSSTGGRPTASYAVNPLVHELFRFSPGTPGNIPPVSGASGRGADSSSMVVSVSPVSPGGENTYAEEESEESRGGIDFAARLRSSRSSSRGISEYETEGPGETGKPSDDVEDPQQDAPKPASPIAGSDPAIAGETGETTWRAPPDDWVAELWGAS